MDTEIRTTAAVPNDPGDFMTRGGATPKKTEYFKPRDRGIFVGRILFANGRFENSAAHDNSEPVANARSDTVTVRKTSGRDGVCQRDTESEY